MCWPSTATWPTRASRRRSSWRCAWAGRCCSEGEAGVGKTEVAKVLARWTGGELCGCSATRASTSPRPSTSGTTPASSSTCAPPRPPGWEPTGPPTLEDELYSERFLVRRPLLRAIAGTQGDGPVPILLIDEIDRADDEFEAFLLEILSDYTVTVPELGTFRAARPPVVISPRTAPATCTTR